MGETITAVVLVVLIVVLVAGVLMTDLPEDR